MKWTKVENFFFCINIMQFISWDICLQRFQFFSNIICIKDNLNKNTPDTKVFFKTAFIKEVWNRLVLRGTFRSAGAWGTWWREQNWPCYCPQHTSAPPRSPQPGSLSLLFLDVFFFLQKVAQKVPLKIQSNIFFIFRQHENPRFTI